jgi:hypothetical protein
METKIVTTQKQISYMLLTLLIAACCCRAALAQAQVPAKAKAQYQVSNLDALGGTNSRGNSINDETWVAGYSNLAGLTGLHPDRAVSGCSVSPHRVKSWA